MSMTQRQWRTAGAIVLVLAAAMAVSAIVSDVLRNTVLLLADLSAPEPIEGADAIAPLPLVLYWLVFALLITAALYFAVKDMRYIRAQYNLERREILRRALEDESFKDALNRARLEQNADAKRRS